MPSLVWDVDLSLSLPPLTTFQYKSHLKIYVQESAPVHQAFIAAPAQAPAPAGRGGARGGGPPRGPGGGRGYRGGRPRGGRGRGGRGGYYQQQQPYGAQPYGGYHGQQPIPPPPRPPSFSGVPGFPSVDASYQNPPNPVVCQLCFSPGHSALNCSRFIGSNSPALAVMPTGETNDSVWYPDSGASAHMTPHEGQPNGGASSSGNQ
ncbi:unnamed protein product [Cuscuta epithymum]|uniref:Uncharacterized protein n=1 Tax=Cuscuta epithymum TaxID=186058 RepID=A0AAV0FEQ8_9ASTE|nr:unnamed protein product [Cuscuta epithymum]